MEWLHRYDPWWSERDSINSDEKIERWRESKVRVYPGLYKDILEFIGKKYWGSIFVFRGPRQVGKTTLVKLIIRDLLERGYNPKAILYLPLDAPKIMNTRDFYEALRYFLLRAKTHGCEHTIIFLDEVSALSDWARVIKGMVDSGELSNSIIIATGSHTMGVLSGEELLSGRRGEYSGLKTTGIYYPLSFGEVFKALWGHEVPFKIDDIFDDEKIPVIEDWLADNIEKLMRVLDIYLLTGGYAVALDKYLKQGVIDKEIYEVYVNLLVKDAMRNSLSEKYVLALLDLLSERMTSKLSLNALARDSDLRSHSVVARYLEYLESAYTIITLYPIDLSRKRAVLRKEKKIYFMDPFIFHAVRTYIWAYSNPFEASVEWLSSQENKSRLIEAIVASHLIRLVPIEPWRRVHMLTYYLENREVDLVLRHDAGFTVVEVKWTEQIPKPTRILYKLKTHLKAKLLLTTKDVLKVENNIIYVPVPLLLATAH